MERHFLELLQFNINVPASIYAKYYFDLRQLADDNNLNFPLEPLNNQRAQKLEVRVRSPLSCLHYSQWAEVGHRALWPKKSDNWE